MHESDQVQQRYARRDIAQDQLRYSLLNPAALGEQQVRLRAITQGLRRVGWLDLSARHILEVGCGSGGGLLDWVRLGAAPGHLTGLELLPERLAQARACLPSAVTLHGGDAFQAPIQPASQDLVVQATVFSSLLDTTYQAQLAQKMWSWLKPGGRVLWYDLAFNNPANPDVRGVPGQRVAELFPAGRISSQRLTLVPPLARRVTRWHPGLYGVLHTLFFLRSHLLAWIEKPAQA